jgi:hypothetical protein
MLALAIVEHAMLVLPVSTTALWRWAMGERAAALPPNDPNGPPGPEAGGLDSAPPPSRSDVSEHKKNALRAEAAPLPTDKHEQLLHAR